MTVMGKKMDQNFGSTYEFAFTYFNLSVFQAIPARLFILLLIRTPSTAGVKCRRCFLGSAWCFGQVCCAEAPRQPKPRWLCWQGWAPHHPWMQSRVAELGSALPEFAEGLAAIPLGHTFPWLAVPQGAPLCNPVPAELHNSRGLPESLQCWGFLKVVSFKNKERSKRTFRGEVCVWPKKVLANSRNWCFPNKGQKHLEMIYA